MKFLAGAAVIFLGLAFAAALSLLTGWLGQLVWNALDSSLFHVHQLTFWQAWQILFLVHLLKSNTTINNTKEK